MAEDYPELYRQGVRLFNERRFFDCHDALEESWTDTLGPERELYQGLIQAAVALFHFGNGNFGGARRMYFSSARYLQPYRPRYMGIDLERFLADMESCFRELLDAGETYLTDAALDEERIPLIHLG